VPKRHKYACDGTLTHRKNSDRQCIPDNIEDVDADDKGACCARLDQRGKASETDGGCGELGRARFLTSSVESRANKHQAPLKNNMSCAVLIYFTTMNAGLL